MSDEDDSFSFISFWKENLPTRNIFILIILVYLVTSIISITLTGISSFQDLFAVSDQVLIYIGQSNELVMEGFVYELITSIFVHINLIHLLSNCLFLLIFGLRAEERIISWQYYIIFIGAGLAGSLLSLLIFDLNTISAGASGGIFGLLATNLVLSYEENKRRSLWSYLGAGVIFLVLSGGIQVNSLAHAIGFIVGLILTLFVFKKRKKKINVLAKEINP